MSPPPRRPRLRHAVRDEVVHSGPGARAAYERARAQVMAFTFYDPRTVAVDLPPGGIAPGVEFVQRLRVGPLRLRGPVRVLDAWDRPTAAGREAGFTYEALPGHPEAGQAAFAVALQGGTVRFRIESRSAPALWFVRLGAPAARLVQSRAVAGAFRRMRQAVRGPGPAESKR